jgi:hypothetical protein
MKKFFVVYLGGCSGYSGALSALHRSVLLAILSMGLAFASMMLVSIWFTERR